MRNDHGVAQTGRPDQLFRTREILFATARVSARGSRAQQFVPPKALQ